MIENQYRKRKEKLAMVQSLSLIQVKWKYNSQNSIQILNKSLEIFVLFHQNLSKLIK